MSQSPRLSLWSACLGNLLEHYDTALFSLLTPFLAPLFFPKSDPITALIFTYAMIPLGMVARPLGSLVMGYVGDTRGRERALFYSLSGMGLVSLGLAICPSHALVGYLSPLIFCIGRLMQNFLAAGETMGGAIFLLENTPKKHHEILSSIFNGSTMGGYLLASAGVFLLSCFGNIEKQWRLLYLLGCSTALFGLFLRRSQSRQLDVKRASPAPTPRLIFKIFFDHWRPLLLIALTSGFAYSCYSIALVLMNGFIPLISSITREEMSRLNTLLLVIDFAALPFFGYISSKISKEKIMLIAALLVAITAAPLFMLLEGATLFKVGLIRLVFVLFGVAFFAPFHAFASEKVPSSHRYLIISFGYALGAQLLGGPAAAISLWIYKQSGMVVGACWYWIFLAMLSLVALRPSLSREKVA